MWTTQILLFTSNPIQSIQPCTQIQAAKLKYAPWHRYRNQCKAPRRWRQFSPQKNLDTELSCSTKPRISSSGAPEIRKFNNSKIPYGDKELRARTCLDDGAGLLTLLAAFFGLAAIGADNGNPGQPVRHLGADRGGARKGSCGSRLRSRLWKNLFKGRKGGSSEQERERKGQGKVEALWKPQTLNCCYPAVCCFTIFCFGLCLGPDSCFATFALTGVASTSFFFFFFLFYLLMFYQLKNSPN